MIQQGFKKSTSDHCIFVQKFFDTNFIFLLLYVNDMLIVGQNLSRINSLKKELSKSFAMKDLGPARQILGMHISVIEKPRNYGCHKKSTLRRYFNVFI